VLLVVIGPHWLTLTDEAGQRRIDDPRDWLHREIAEALHHRLRIIPIRSSELAALTGLLRDRADTGGTVVISAIGGTAGVGKPKSGS
jgi:hypothetical protein